MRLACNINFFRFVSNSFFKDLNIQYTCILGTLGSIAWHLKIPSLQCLSSILSAFAIGIIDNPLGVARTVAKNARGICVFPLESFRFKRLRSSPSGNRPMFHRCATRWNILFYREASLPTICYAVYWMSLYWFEKKKIKEKYFKLRYARHFFRYTVPCILCAGSFFFRGKCRIVL